MSPMKCTMHKKSALKMQAKMAWLFHQMHFYLRFTFVNTINRFRVGVSVGGTLFSNMISINHFSTTYQISFPVMI